MVDKKWLPLKPGDTIDIIAPAAGHDDGVLAKIKDFLASWQLQAHIPVDLFGKDLLCANSDTQRFKQLQTALFNTRSKAIWCLRGGYGCSRLLPLLSKLKPPSQTKLFMGFSDITALHIFLQEKWHWPTLHSPSLYQSVNRTITASSIQQTKALIFGQQPQAEFHNLLPLNKAAQQPLLIKAPIIGGNLSLVQVSLGTNWQPCVKNKILFLEEVNERGYQIDRMLVHLTQAKLFSGIKALVLGDFTKGQDPDGRTRVKAVLKNFAEQCAFPVVQAKGIGHAKINKPLPLGTASTLELGKKCHLQVNAGFINTL